MILVKDLINALKNFDPQAFVLITDQLGEPVDIDKIEPKELWQEVRDDAVSPDYWINPPSSQICKPVNTVCLS
jgi:hypothetical protein